MDASDVIFASEAVGARDKELRKKIYFLLDGLDIVYIGSSGSPKDRLKEHKSNKKRFDRVSVFDVSEQSIINEIEADLIVRFNPKLNKIVHANKLIRMCDKDDNGVCFSRVVDRSLYSGKPGETVMTKREIYYKYVGDGLDYSLFDKDGNAYHVSPKHVMKKPVKKEEE